MVDEVKVLIVEKNGVELEFQEEHNLSAENVTFDNTSTAYVSDDVQGALEEIETNITTSASPGFSFGRSGNVSSNTWLRNEGVVSHKAGRYVYINSARITEVFVSSEDIDTYDVVVYEHEGDSINLTLLSTHSIVAARGGSFSVNVPVTTGRQLAIRIRNGSAKNVVVGLALLGSS